MTFLVNYTLETREKALRLMATTGSPKQAQRILAEQGIVIPHQTLYYWRIHSQKDRYAEIQAEIAPELEQRIIQGTREVLAQATAAEQALLEDLLEKKGSLDARDLATALRNVSTTKGINATQLLALTGRPTQITEHRDGTKTLEALQRLGLVVDGTAEDDDTPGIPESAGSSHQPHPPAGL